MLQSTINSVFFSTIFLLLLQTSSAYQLSSLQWKDRTILPPERLAPWPYWLDGIYDDDEELMAKRSGTLPSALERLKKFRTPEEKQRFVAALNTYYMIFGRPR